MHRLEEQVAQWKKQIVQSDCLSQSDLTELEQHLHDSMEDLQGRGLSAEESFLIASTRLGPQDALATEFGKVNGNYIWRRRVFWMLAGYLAIRLAGAWIGSLSSVTTAITAYAGLNGTMMGIVSVGVTCVGWAVLLVALFLLATQGGLGAQRVFSETSSMLLALGLMVAIVAGLALTTTGRVVTARLVSAETFGQSAIVASWASLALQVMIPCICLAMMFALRQRGWGALQTR